ncbi:hypothetical protein J132_09334 [Termitomyces sp. J132]|nr:hypothetical protein H2248_001771 [Termitomyces sp. 'cryptogamus']KNZ73881.1 hypothetical protein J132_09334 [Termitomyces sp. J132]
MSSTHHLNKELTPNKLESVDLVNSGVDLVNSGVDFENSSVLSVDHEASQKCFLVTTAGDALEHPNSNSLRQQLPDQSTDTLPEHVARLSLASAAQKQLPSEILEQIFRLGSEGLDSVVLPPMLSDYRWVLGRVCSDWRRVSRSIPFWKAVIEFVDTGRWQEPYDVARPLKEFRCAVDILPEIARILLIVDRNDGITTGALIPHLACVKELNYAIRSTQGLMEIFPPGALSGLECLRVYARLPPLEEDEPTHINPFVGFVAKSLRLQHLEILSEGLPTFLLSDIPWSQLQSFHLIIGDTYIDDVNTQNSWTDLAEHDPFQHMHSLQDLELNMRAWFFDTLLPCQFPWHRLTTLNLVFQDFSCYLFLIMDPLPKCTSLVTLKMSGGPYFYGNHRRPPHEIKVDDVGPILLPSLQTLEIKLPPSTIMSVCSSGTLGSLEAYSMTLQDFYTIATMCPHLTNFKSRLVRGWLATNIAGLITLPHLTSLDIDLDDSLSFPAAIIGPLLSFNVYQKDFGPDLVRLIIDFIVRLNLRLQRISCSAGLYSETAHNLPSPLREFLTTIDDCEDVNIKGMIFPEEILDEILSGRLLSRTRYLAITIDSSDPDVPFAVIQRCLEQRAASCQATLRAIHVYYRDGWSAAQRDQEKKVAFRLKGLEEKYNVRCSVEA